MPSPPPHAGDSIPEPENWSSRNTSPFPPLRSKSLSVVSALITREYVIHVTADNPDHEYRICITANPAIHKYKVRVVADSPVHSYVILVTTGDDPILPNPLLSDLIATLPSTTERQRFTHTATTCLKPERDVSNSLPIEDLGEFVIHILPDSPVHDYRIRMKADTKIHKYKVRVVSGTPLHSYIINIGTEVPPPLQLFAEDPPNIPTLSNLLQTTCPDCGAEALPMTTAPDSVQNILNTIPKQLENSEPLCCDSSTPLSSSLLVDIVKPSNMKNKIKRKRLRGKNRKRISARIAKFLRRLTLPSIQLNSLTATLIFWIIILFTLSLPTIIYADKAYPDIYSLMARTTSASLTKQVFLIKDYKIISLPLHLLEIESAIDSLTYRLTSLKYSSDVEMAEPRLMMGSNFLTDNSGSYLLGGIPVTIFNRILTLHDANTLCGRMNLRVLELDNLPSNLRATELLLHFEITITNGKIICSSATVGKKDADCIQYILFHTKHREFIRTPSELTRALQAYRNNKLYIKATETQFLFTTANYGVMGCEGDYQSRESDPSKQFQKDLHSNYFKSLGGLYISLYGNLNNYVDFISEAIHQFSTDSPMIPPNLVNNSMIMEGIIELLPTYVPSLNMPRMKFTKFTTFFNSHVSESNDDIIETFRQSSYLLRFKPRQLKAIYAAAEQFNVNTRIRVSKFALHFMDELFLKKIPNSWLLRRDQNVGTFIMQANSFISSIDDQVLLELYTIVHNRKVNLLKDLAPYYQKKIEIKYLKHLEVDNFRPNPRTQLVKLPPSSTLPPVINNDVQGNEENPSNFDEFMNNDEPSLLEIEDLLLVPNPLTTTSLTTPPSTTPLNAILPRPGSNPVSLPATPSLGPLTVSSLNENDGPSQVVDHLLIPSIPDYGSPANLPETLNDSPSSENTLSEAPGPPPTLADPPVVEPLSDSHFPILSILTTTSSPETSSTRRAFNSAAEYARFMLARKTQTETQMWRKKRSIDAIYRNHSFVPLKLSDLFYSLNSSIKHGYADFASISDGPSKTRTKRSGFWTKIFGVATSDDLVEAYRNEVDVGLRLDADEKTVEAISGKTNELLKNYKSLALDLQKVETQERGLFEYIDKIVKAEGDSLKKLELLAKSIDKITVMNSEYQNLNVQTMLLINTIEKLHSLVQNALSGQVDIAQMPVELLQMYSPNNLQISLKTTHTEFVYGRSGYSLKLRIPELSPPFMMYSIRSIPIYIKNHWSTISLKTELILNSVKDVLEHSVPLSSICDQGDNYFLCNPSDIIVRHSQSSCEIDIIDSLDSRTPTYPNCNFDSVKLNAQDQYSLVVRGSLSISSMDEDKMHYICEKDDQSKIVDVQSGFSIHETIEGCVYETSKLTIYNSPVEKILTEYKDLDIELNIINALSSLENLLDDSIMNDYSNITSIEAVVKDYEKMQVESEVTYGKLMSDVKMAQDVLTLNNFSPLKVDLRRPMQQSNWLTGIFWFTMIIIFLIFMGCFCRMCPNCLPMIFSSMNWCCTGYFRGIKTAWHSRGKEANANLPDTLPEAPAEAVPLIPHVSNTLSGLPPHSIMEGVHFNSHMEALSSSLMDPNLLERIPLFNSKVMYPKLESNYESARPYHIWRISKGKYNEYLLTSLVPDGLGGVATVFYDLVDGQTIDQYNRQLPYISSPEPNLISVYREKVKNSPAPPYVLEKGLYTLPGAPHIAFSFETNHWTNRSTKRIITGLSPPTGLGAPLRG